MNKLTVEEKALSINLQPSIYGTFAEIGAGQEVANCFYKVGAASGTIAKTISAYDMTLSDRQYGTTKRYVSKDRLENMLRTEFEQLVLGLTFRATTSHFFAFASTVEITNFHRTNKGRGWLGIKFQSVPNGPPSTCILHFIMHNDDPQEQKRIIGMLGVNLIHGVYEALESPEMFIENLTQEIHATDIEINSIEVDGREFRKASTQQLSLLLVKQGLTRMIMFGYNKEIIQPLNVLHKKDLLLIRGRFNPPTKVSCEMIEKAKRSVHTNGGSKQQNYNLVTVAEITFRCFESFDELQLDDLDRRISMLSELGVMVMVTNFTYHSDFIEFMHKYSTINDLYLVLGLNNLRKVFEDRNRHANSTNGLRFVQSIINTRYKVLAFPELNSKGELQGVESIGLDKANTLLMLYLMHSQGIQNIENVNKQVLQIRSDAVVDALVHNSPDWKQMVPPGLIGWLESQMVHSSSTIQA